MIQVKIFESSKRKVLEDSINEFISENPKLNIVDIKFNAAFPVDPEWIGTGSCYAAMVIFK